MAKSAVCPCLGTAGQGLPPHIRSAKECLLRLSAYNSWGSDLRGPENSGQACAEGLMSVLTLEASCAD